MSLDSKLEGIPSASQNTRTRHDDLCKTAHYLEITAGRPWSPLGVTPLPEGARRAERVNLPWGGVRASASRAASNGSMRCHPGIPVGFLRVGALDDRYGLVRRSEVAR